MSKAPEGFPLPDEIVNSLEKYAKDNASDLAEKQFEEFQKSIVENNIPKNQSDTNIKTGEKITEPKKKLRTGAEVVLDRIKQEEEISDIRKKRSEREDVSKRVGGSAFKQKALDAIRKAEKADQNKPIFERPEKTTKNKKFDPESKSTRRYKRLKEEENLLIHRDNLKGVSVSSLPDEGEIENTNFPKNSFSKKEKKYKDISKEEPNIEFYEDEYDPNGPIDSELPDPSNIIGKDLEFETGKKLKSSKEKVIKDTQDVADEYNLGKLKKEDIQNTKSLDELIKIINNSEGIQGSNDYFDKETLIEIIDKVQKGELTIDYVTRSSGLRQKVFDLLNNAPVVEEKTEEVAPQEESVDILENDIPEKNNVVIEESRGQKEEVIPKSNKKTYFDELENESPTPLPDINSKITGETLVFENPKSSLPEKKRISRKKPAQSVVKEQSVVEEGKPEKELNINDTIDKLQSDLSLKGAQLIELYKQKSGLDEKYTETPWKRFKFKGLGIGKKEINEVNKKIESIEAEYKDIFDYLVTNIAEIRFYEFSTEKINDPESIKYQMVNFDNVPKSIKLKYSPEENEKIEEIFNKIDPIGVGVRINDVVVNREFPKGFTDEFLDFFTESLKRRITKDVRKEQINSEDRKYFKFLN